MTEALKDLAEYVEKKRSDCVISWDVKNGELNISVAPSNIASFVEFLRSCLLYTSPSPRDRG